MMEGIIMFKIDERGNINPLICNKVTDNFIWMSGFKFRRHGIDEEDITEKYFETKGEAKQALLNKKKKELEKSMGRTLSLYNRYIELIMKFANE